MSSDASCLTQEYMMNSLMIGHPLVYHSHSNNEDSNGKTPDKDDTHVGFNFMYACSTKTDSSQYRTRVVTLWIRVSRIYLQSCTAYQID